MSAFGWLDLFPFSYHSALFFRPDWCGSLFPLWLQRLVRLFWWISWKKVWIWQKRKEKKKKKAEPRANTDRLFLFSSLWQGCNRDWWQDDDDQRFSYWNLEWTDLDILSFGLFYSCQNENSTCPVHWLADSFKTLPQLLIWCSLISTTRFPYTSWTVGKTSSWKIIDVYRLVWKVTLFLFYSRNPKHYSKGG